jgi:hypothetical protein
MIDETGVYDELAVIGQQQLFASNFRPAKAAEVVRLVLREEANAELCLLSSGEVGLRVGDGEWLIGTRVLASALRYLLQDDYSETKAEAVFRVLETTLPKVSARALEFAT